MTTIKLISEEKERKRLRHNSLIQKFNESGESITPVLRPIISKLLLMPNSLKINRLYKDRRTLQHVGLYNNDLLGKIKQNTFIYADCDAFFDNIKYDIVSLDDSNLYKMPIDFIIYSADIDESLFYSGCALNQTLRTDIFLNHHEFQKLENAIEKQNLESCYLKTDIRGIYSDVIFGSRTSENSKNLFYLSESMSSEVQDIDLINYGSEKKHDLARGNDLLSSKMAYQFDFEFSYQIEQKIEK
ncbi:hypothetical protein OAL90_01385 [Hyphomicrobiales bacterium]|nr:hypothetical protein [Hyphomicrobiales bacterium]